jgi:NADH-quinone oxidoreductase subunit N
MVVIAVENRTGGEEVVSFAGLAERAPFSAIVMTLALFSLAGLPFLAGFITKFYLFTAASERGFLWLAGLAIHNSLISLYYYLGIVRQMYVEAPAERGAVATPALTIAVLTTMVAGTILIGVFPAPLVDLIEAANSSLGSLVPVR